MKTLSNPLLPVLIVSTVGICLGEQQRAPKSMRILALFSTTSNELGLDHRIGKQVLKLATQKAVQMYPGSSIEVLVDSNEIECSSINEMPNRVAEQYYSLDSFEECKKDATLNSTNSTCSQQDYDLRQLDRFFPPSSSRRLRRQAVVEMASDKMNSASSIDAILGPSCHYLVDMIARMAAYWRLPIYSVASISAQFANKDIYPTLTRLSPSIDQLSIFIVKVMQTFNWINLAVIIDPNQNENSLMLENLERTITRQAHRHPIEMIVFQFTSQTAHKSSNQTGTSGRCTQEAREVLMSSRRVARVVLLLIEGQQTIRQLLLCAHRLNFHTGGFTFLALDLGLKSVNIQQQQAPSLSSATKSSRQTFDWYMADDEENNAPARQMFESLMVLSVELPIGDEYNLFVEQIIDLAHQQYPQVRFDRSAVNSLAVALHDSFLLAVEAHMKSDTDRQSLFINKTRSDEADWGTAAAGASGRVPLMWNKHIESASRGGFISTSLYINSNGDQELNYVLNDLEPELGMMRPVASFSKETRQLELLPDTYIHWPKRMNTLSRELVDIDRVPPNQPECGFDDLADHCIDRQNLYAALTILVSLIGILALGSAFSLHKYRNIKYQMQLDDYWWKINWQDLQFIQMTDSLASNPQSVVRALKSGASVVSANSDGAASFVNIVKPAGNKTKLAEKNASHTESVVSKTLHRQQRRQAVPLIVTSSSSNSAEAPGVARRDQLSTHSQDDAKSGLTKISGSLLASGSVLIRSEYSSVVRASNLAMYKDELVIVKQLNADKIEMTRDLLVELKSIRELVNDNLARFVGLCLDPQRLAIVYEFCSRGSLQDLILNKDVVMDLTLKYSIIGDIVNGLSFIHTTLLDYHGRLKSTNLVLDGRFTVKITDFGLQNLYSQLDLIQNQVQDETEEDNKSEDEDTESNRPHEDQVSLSVSQTAYNMESISVVGAKNSSNRLNGSQAGGGLAGYKRVKLRNRGSARFFWTAPEHLREKNSHFSGSKRGDIYSLAIILLELITRREPYYYGTNAQPHWPNINRDRRLFMQMQQQQQQPPDQQLTGSRILRSISRKSGSSTHSQQLGSEVPAGKRPGRVVAVRSNVKRNSVSPAIVEQQEAMSVISASGVSQASSSRQKQASIGDRDQTSEVEEIDELGSLPLHEMAGDPKVIKGPSEPLDAEEILDQLRMGIKPEPVRPFIPNYVTLSVSPKLIELTRACWNESAKLRPPLSQVRTQLRKISRGLASKNYLDNLLERLQNYAADLERIVDGKSADIMGEKLRTEELLYQLVPKFVAERLKRNEPIVPQVFDGVTIFFSDIVGFEKYASVMSPIELVDLLNSVYSSFDSIISSFDVTKIETIIDQFLVAAGISFQQQQQQRNPPAIEATENESAEPTSSGKKGDSRSKGAKLKRGLLGSLAKGNSHPSQDQNDSLDRQQPSVADSNHYRRSSAEQIGRMALCIRDLVKSFHFRQNMSQHQTTLTGSTFNIRIGIHSGKVCAGIVGLKRPKFCLIGDTVNVASRMHTNSKANRIQISDDTRQLLEQVPGFSIEPRGKIEVKGKGSMETFWLESSY